jgi:hypothetical protein
MRRVIPVALTFLIILNLSACENVPLSVEVEAADYIVVADVPDAPENAEIDIDSEETKLDEIEYKTIEPPEDGWTLELLNEVTYINGKDIDLPFCVADLGDDFDVGSFNYIDDGKDTAVQVNYKGRFAFYSYSGNFGEEFDINDNIDVIALTENLNESKLIFSDFININGVNIGDSKEEVIKAVGSYTKRANFLFVKINNNEEAIMFQFDQSDKLITIALVIREV